MPPELKNVQHLPEKLGTVQVLLDGQQRLTTLHMLLTGEIPSFYTDPDIQNDPRDLYFNLETTDFQYYQKSRMDGDSLWQRYDFLLPGQYHQRLRHRTRTFRQS